MPIPDATLAIKDGALGLVPQDTSGIQAVIGTCSLGTANVVQSFGDQQALKDSLGTGPLVEYASYLLSLGGGPVICVKAPSSTAGSAGSVTPVGAGTSVMTVTGTPLDSYNVVVKILTAAAAVTSGVGTFKISLDGGVTYGNEIALPVASTYLIPNTGLTLNFAAGTLVKGDTYAFVCVAPAYSLSDLNTAMTALLADPSTWFQVTCLGLPADAAASAAIFAALDSKLSTAEAGYRFAKAAMQAADVSDANLITAFSALASTRVEVVAGFCDVTSALSGFAFKRGALFPVAARASKAPPSEDLGRVASGPLKGVTKLYRDEFASPGLDAQRFSTLRTHVGLAGFYITNSRQMASQSSDFRYTQFRRVMDVASASVRASQLRYLNDNVRVNSTTGLILEEDARNVEKYIESRLRTAVTQQGFASEVAVTVDRTNNLLTTNELKVKYRVIPLGYTKAITGEIGFFNPQVVAV